MISRWGSFFLFFVIFHGLKLFLICVDVNLFRQDNLYFICKTESVIITKQTFYCCCTSCNLFFSHPRLNTPICSGLKGFIVSVAPPTLSMLLHKFKVFINVKQCFQFWPRLLQRRRPYQSVQYSGKDALDLQKRGKSYLPSFLYHYSHYHVRKDVSSKATPLIFLLKIDC